MEKAKELFNHVPSDESISITAWFHLALSVITAALSIWHIISSLISFSLLYLILNVALLAGLVACMYFNKKYIDGIKERDDKKMAPFRISFVLEKIVDFYYYNIVSCIILLPIAIYLFKIFNALYVKIRDENLTGSGAASGGNPIAVVIDAEATKDRGQKY